MTTHLDDSTPLMKQYGELKAQAPDALLLFRMGDFYELFGEDAVIAANILEITLTSRDKNKPQPMPMAGVPHHSIQGYIQKLLKAGKKIAIGEQMEDPKITQGTGKIVRREIVRILTPGIQFDAEGSESNYLATAVRLENRKWILACLDVSTGETLLSDPLEVRDLLDALQRVCIRHFLLPEGLDLQSSLSPATTLIEPLVKNYISLERATALLQLHYETAHIAAWIPTKEAIFALGILVTYALRTQQQEKLAHLRPPEPLQKPQSLILGPNTAEHLDLPDLFQLINQTRSSIGARQLKRWMMAPLQIPAEISHRQNAVKELSSRWAEMGEKISVEIAQVYDLERICGRINAQLANPRDTLALGQSLSTLGKLEQILSSSQSPVLIHLKEQISELSPRLSPLSEKIVRIQKESPPIHSREGGIFRLRTTPELDHLISLTEDGERWLIDLETREREITGIPSLKVRYNRVFGYYIEITQTHLKSVPSHYQRKQTMVGAERFFTEELKKFEEEILNASVKQKSLEQELFKELLGEIQKLSDPIMKAAQVLGELDSLLSLSRLTQMSQWNFPKIDDSLELHIRAGRHPLVDPVKQGAFVPNDLSLSPQTCLNLIITGPNMGGKSTIMRQVALILILGQMGAPVPAQQAHWGVVSSIYTRIGAQDAITRGQSTFMVEMSELAHILHHADKRSFLVLDEIGRGTSTYDGISVAWATLEWICNQIQARTLFATHYHELTRLSASLPLLANAHMAVEGTKGSQKNSLRFLYELRKGPANESFGIQVAQLAGLPQAVIQRAWKVLNELEGSPQLSLFAPPSETKKEVQTEPLVPHPIFQEIESVDINQMTPLQALGFVVKLKELCSASESNPQMQ